MARTIQQIKQSIIDAKEADSNLNGLTSTSKVALWLLWVNVVALVVYTLEQLWDLKKAELEQAAYLAETGTEQWYAERVKEWQYNYQLYVIDGRLRYLTIDEEARLVTKVASITENGVLKIKVAKGDDELEPLSEDEQVSLDTYIRDIKFAGVSHDLISVEADSIKITGATVYFDGKLDPTIFASTFEAAIEQHLKDIFFNGILNINKLQRAGEVVPGCVDFLVGTLEAKSDIGTYSTVVLNYNPRSGYFKIDPSFPLNSNITYIPV